METLNLIMWYALIFIAILYFISGIDDLFLDLIYWVRYFYRKCKTGKKKKPTYDDLCSVQEKKIAIMIACWQETDVIKDMLKYNIPLIDYTNYDVFVGTYPNDPETIQAVKEIEDDFSNVHKIIGKDNGPTNKADNLNKIYQYIKKRENELNTKYEIFVMHDSEDIIHPLSLKLYNYFIPKKDIIQTPVFPLPLEHKEWVHWIYADEFAEKHTKELVVREVMHSFIPSAGVGTAFSHASLENLAKKHPDAKPFFQDTLTEDYDSALRLQLEKAKATFLLQPICRVIKKKSWWMFGKERYIKKKILVATHALFPTKWAKAARQRGRWTLGIAFQTWKNIGWPGNWIIKYFLFRDRKSIITFPFVGIEYIVLIYWIVVYFWNLFDPISKTLFYYLTQSPWVFILIIACTFLMLQRIFEGIVATTRIYGFIPGLLSVPRSIPANIMFAQSCLLAYLSFFFPKKGQKAKWEKTKNRFPMPEQLKKYNFMLEDYLLLKQYISDDDLKMALTEKIKTGQRLGDILLCKYNLIDKKQLITAIAKTFHMPTIEFAANKTLPFEKLTGVSKEAYDFLLDNKLYPIAQEGNKITLTIFDPSMTDLIDKAKQILAPNKVKFIFAITSKDWCAMK